jgi:prepilin-type processing-associated H-X9-DG protein
MEDTKMSKRDKSKKLTAVEILVVVFMCLFLLVVIGPASQKSQFDAYRIECSKNLSLIGKAMLIYANDYDGELPRSGGRNSLWTPIIPDWQARNRFGAYRLAADGSGGGGSISSCFYLLVKYAEVAPKSFVCPGDSGTTEFKLADVDAGEGRLIELWDFGPEPSRHCSYAYHMPFSLYRLTTSSEPGMAVAADRNPWINSLAGEPKDMAGPPPFDPEGGREAVKAGNAIAHDEEGQNVLFLDGHVVFEEHPFCGMKKDNIYTYWDGGDIRVGGVPRVGSEPAGRLDSLLVNDPAIYKVTTTKQPKAVNSADLKQTSVVATLDCPVPEHKNVIWCATFQMTWDKLKEEIIGESIKVPDAEQLAARLNQSKFAPENLEAESFYATVGFVKKGIVEQIQKEMSRCFPSESVPPFDELGALPPELQAGAIVSYSYLSADIGFKYPFYTRENAFGFESSNGKLTDVTSFCDSAEGTDLNKKPVRGQVDILYYKYGDQSSAAEFAVDLCRHAVPYQVVLARVPRQNTLGQTVVVVEQKISEFKHDSNYEVLCKLRPIDRLIVPDVLYKLTHRFAELESKGLANRRLPGYFFFEALQMIDFALSRTGVVLKSEARVIVAPFRNGSRRLEEPRHLFFNRPFLIYVRKRGVDYSPFFVMWVDNAELMEEF